MTSRPLPGPLIGALAGALLTAALIAVFYAGWQLAGLAFVPFDIFDWFSRVLPGAIIEFVIGVMVAVIGALHLGPTAAAAKAIEQAIGVNIVFYTGVLGGAILFSVLRLLRGRFAYTLGLVFGLVVGVPALLISYSLSQTGRVAPGVSALWILIVFLFWGAAYARTFERLSESAAVPPARAGHPRLELVNRRQFLVRLAGTTAIITVSGAVVGALAARSRRMVPPAADRWSSMHELPNAGAAVKPAPGTRPEFTPLERHYRIDINTVPPSINEQAWGLRISGLVQKPLEITLDELRRREPLHQFITLSCISNPVGGDLTGTTRWTGVSLRQLLPVLGLRPEASHLKIRSADGFWEVVPIETIRADGRIMLVYAWDGVPLLREHGFPLRIYIPDLYGMKQPKWIDSIEATDHWEPGYWVVRGWDKIARMKATSVIDTVAVNMDIIKGDRRMIVPIGGIAHAGARGISRVELKVDDGHWQQAKLRTPLSDLTWVIWRFDWPFQSGKHTFTVRCFDGQGTAQIVEPRPPAPDGASGLFSKTQKL